MQAVESAITRVELALHLSYYMMNFIYQQHVNGLTPDQPLKVIQTQEMNYLTDFPKMFRRRQQR